MGEPTKPVYSTFFEKGKEYDGSNVRFFKQREAVIGKNVGDSVDPQNYLKKGGGVRHVVPPVREEKLYCKPPLVDEFRQSGNGNENGAAGNEKSTGTGELDENGMPRSRNNGARPAEGCGTHPSEGDDTRPNEGYGAGLAEGYGPRSAGEEDGEGLGRGRGTQGHDGIEYDQDGNPLYGQRGVGDANADGECRDSHLATKNFVASNIVETSNMVPRRRKVQVPLATERKSFGQAPAYLTRVKGEVAQEKAFVKSLDDAKVQHQQNVFSKYVYLLPREEHEKLVGDLKKRRDECLSELQKMPFSKDIPSMRKRRAELERTIADIDNALRKLDKDALFIYKDDPVNGQWAKEAALKEAQKYAAESL
ncbi:hypothetical protein ABL78_5431 [Leptomonas seymouri]|uniref:Enkurin domain-containing protein n=1 Tax=Leptomonas seymouri TaxID=5684 RepID=A0A0N1IJA5_LEPSE|nr:hypothetical protein ABL78_5431 [Leptomonas seymouri]|eukprot:KPI85511.1 hypothetical protein ABL78_5431 [Leptomonas seymouri]